MRIGVVNVQVPFVTGGAERHAATLCRAFRERGYDATGITVPFKWYPAQTLVDHVLAAKLLDLGEVGGVPVDLMVGLKFPAWLARHPDKVFWVLHQHRQAYDMWDSGLSDLLHDPEGAAVRALIHEEDRRALGAPGTRVYANSRNVAGRMKRFLGIASTPLYHPPPQAERMRQGAYGDYLFAPSRMNESKRQMLMIEALALCDSATRIVFAGPPDSPAFLGTLKAKARELGVESRVTVLGAVDDETMLRHYAECRGVVFVPIDEDYGYITLEAMLSGKPVVTATDSGGALEFVEDGVEGFVVAPEAAALAKTFDTLMEDAALAERMGTAGLARYRAMGIGWDTVVETLTDGRGPGTAAFPVREEKPDAGETRAVEPGKGSDAPGAADGPSGHEADGAGSAAATPEGDGAVIPVALPPTPAAVDLEALRAKIAPDLPDDPPFGSVEALLAAYDFDTYDTGRDPDLEALAPYFDTHWKRYLATLKLVLAGRTGRVLDVGVFPPFLFQALLTAARPGSRIDGVWEGPEPFAQTVTALRADLDSFDIALAPANVERDPLPFPDSTFDLVTGMEILEHFAVDPLFFVAEAARVLRPGGRIVLTTPNVTSHRGVRKILDGNAPYSFGIYVPTGGVYGRHNREFAPHEVERLCAAAGFATESLATADVYDDRIDPEAARLLEGRGDFGLRGETILYAGRLERHVPVALPENLYHGDPRQLSGSLRVLDRDRETGRTRIGVGNTSRALWETAGERAVSLYLSWYDARGTLVHGGGRAALEGPLAPGAQGEVSLVLSPGAPDGARGMIGIDLWQAGSGLMSGAGRTRSLRLPCAEDAFLRLAREPQGSGEL